VLAVHGFEGYAAKDCRAEFSSLSARFGARLRTVGYYAGDTGADLTLPGEPATTGTPVAVLGELLATLISTAFEGQPVDLIGHSMGGLIVQSALPRLPSGAVRKVAMLGVPFDGLPSAVGVDVAQCIDMTPGSDLLLGLQRSGIRADLYIGSEADEAVPISSSLPAGTELRQLRLPESMHIHHGDLLHHSVPLDATVALLA
jgi:pimeloyl-ACP methyl ester carboxylesterase